MIEINALTMRYKSGKGIFDLDFKVDEGEVFGYIGPNGAGKTTTIRNLLGFMPPDKGSCSIKGLDCWKHSTQLQKSLGFLPGEIAFPSGMTGTGFLNFISEMRGTKDTRRMKELISRFQLDASGGIRKMSKGMKQKLGIIAAFMHDPCVYILDEPTSGLDPLMQNLFVQLIAEEKRRGKTILMSSHMFEEIDKTCDRAGIIKDGRLVAVEAIALLKEKQKKAYDVTFSGEHEADDFISQDFEAERLSNTSVVVYIRGDVSKVLKALAKYHIVSFDKREQTLEALFMHYYNAEGGQK